ncbi:Intracellular hyphae protein 1 [Colletotrichum higginsianum IMI 349063]|uniref:Intracellular hyphae protein 1 n=2 Tax=Colletotrichum higginsianum TaxID=80884 RepID=A0A1B7Y3I9_COLHI|nr:Intracellular hyphae protein 1 [Colletotrichum higginsianum IMI 349063]OBR06597.1 Intracellular hyphae protein 1 [Colletotrichum higginsianum IMI 349063]TIC96820.1 Intracellular hyphae protein 1 [Colletotrichum higginsianum]
MRSSIIYLALAGLTSFAQANPLNKPPPQTDPRGLITRGLSNVFSPTKRQAAAPPAIPQAGGGDVNNASRNVALTVIAGDTLGQIARLLNSGICDIAKLNNVANPDFIEVGQVLQVPINVAAPDNDSCLNRGGAIPPPAGGNASAPAAPAAPAPGGGEGGKKNKK